MQWFRPYIYGLQCVVRTDHAILQWLFRRNADGMTFRMIQKMQMYNYRIVHTPPEKPCNADGHIRRPNKKTEWEEGKEELCVQILEIQTMEKALGGAQEDSKSGSSSQRKHTDVIAHARLHIPHHTRELLKYSTGNFMEWSSSLVFFRLSGDTGVKSSPMTDFVVRYSHLKPTEDSVSHVGGMLVYWDSEQPSYIYLSMTKEKYTDVAKHDDLKT